MKFFKCPDCGTILIPDRSDDFAPKKLVELIPNTTDAAGEKHVPVITVDGSCVKVAVGAAVFGAAGLVLGGYCMGYVHKHAGGDRKLLALSGVVLFISVIAFMLGFVDLANSL